MAQIGKLLKDKHLKQIELFLNQALEDNEKIIGLFKATNGKPQNKLLVLTNQRILTLAKLTKNNSIVDELAADEILELDIHEKFGKARKTYIVNKNGNRIYAGLINGEDAELATRLLPSMSGNPTPLTNILRTANMKNKKKWFIYLYCIRNCGLISLSSIPPSLYTLCNWCICELLFQK